MYMPPNFNIGWITAAKSTERQTITVKARVAKAGDFVRCFRPEIIKIDVEGFEGPVLRSILPEIGDGYRPTFLFEYSYEPGGPFEKLMADNFALLRAAGYRLHLAGGREYSDADIAALSETVDILATV